jgi:hypothetical protein
MLLSSLSLGIAGVRVDVEDGRPAGVTGVDKDGNDGKDGKGVLRVSLLARVASSAGLVFSKPRCP